MAAAWRVKQRIGGAMRQSGVLASYCLYALEHNVERLSEDNERAAAIASTLQGYPGVADILPVETNIIIADLAPDFPTAVQLVAGLGEEGIQIGAFGERRIRIVLHLDVGDEAADALLQALARRLGTTRSSSGGA